MRSRWIRIAVGLVVVVAAFVYGLPRFASYTQVWSQVEDLDRRWLGPLLILGLINLVAPAISFRAALAELRLRDAVVMDWATTTLTNLVPGGSALAIALTWSMLRSFGLAGRAITRAIVVTGVWDTFVKLGTPLLAVAWLALEQPVSPGLVRAAVFGAILFVVAVVLGAAVLTGGGTAARVGRVIDRLRLVGRGWPARLEEMRQETFEMLAGRWPSLTWWTVFGHLNLYLLLLVCLRAVGVDSPQLGAAQVLVAFAFGRLITAIPLTPGGLGVLEVGLVSALGVVGDAPEAAVVAGVLIFRFLNLVVPLPLGAVSWLWWQRRSATSPPTEPEGETPPGTSSRGLAQM